MSALAEFAELKMLPLTLLQSRGLSDDAAGIRVNYGDDGRARIRKTPETAHPTYWASGDTRPMRAFGHELAVKMATGKNKTLLIVEGESDTLTAWHHKRPAIGVPGATMVHVLQRADVDWAERVGIVREPGEAGAKFVVAVARRLRELSFTGEIVEITLSPHEDVSALHIAVNAERDAFSTALDAALAASTPVAAEATPLSANGVRFADVADLTQAFDDDSAFLEHLVEGLLPVSGSMVIGAKKKVGKSVLLANLTRSVARGEPFLGRACKQGRVLYGSFDEPKAVTLERFEALGMKGEPGVFLWATRGGVGPKWDDAVRDRVRHFKPTLFIVDTLAKLANIQEINSYGEWNAAYAPLHKLADEMGFSLAVTVHNKKEGGGFDALAGSTAIGGGVDTIMVIERDPNNVRTIATEQRVGTDMERTILNMDPDTFALGIGPELWLARQREIQQEIIDEIGDKAITLEQITEAVNRRTLQVKRALYAAVDAGFIERSGRGTRGDPRLYNVRRNRDQETQKKPYNTDSIPGPGPIGDQTGPRNSLPLLRPACGPGMDQAGLTGTKRDQETDLLDYANEVLGDA